MDYNWGDPKKNSLLSSRMMAKAEVTRKKRLTSVKSTVSNQLHPAIEQKLRKTKKAPDTARRHLNCEDINPQSNSNNNGIHDADQFMTDPPLVSDDESSTLDTIRHDVFPMPARASYGDNVSMFDEFDLNAAAGGLFHPASTIEAFIEHDAKYRQEMKSAITDKPQSVPRQARSGSENPPSRENHRLPALHSGKAKRDRVSARPESKLQPTSTCTSGTAPTTTSSLSKLLDVDKDKRSLSANHSDSKLYAPRRLDVVPPSADRNALDFFERELESDDNNNPHNSSVLKSSRAIIELDNNDKPGDVSSIVPSLDFSLTRKFEELKQILKSNREKHNSARQNNEQSGNEIPSSGSGAGQPTSSSSKASVHPRTSTRNGPSKTSSAIRASCSGSSYTKNGGSAATMAKSGLNKRSIPAARATADMNNGPTGSKRAFANQVSGAPTRRTSSSVAVVSTPAPRSKKEMKARSGISLSDLKAEHREALQMLKELGGPVDHDYLHADVNSKVHQVGTSITRTTKVNHSSGSTVALAGGKSTNQLQAELLASTPPTSANSGVSMVTKLRESISSGRISGGCSPTTSSPDSPTVSSEHKQEDASKLSESEGDIPPHDSNQTAVRETPCDITTAPDKAASVAPLPPPLSPTKAAADPWKQYKDDKIDAEDEDNNEREHNEVKSARTYTSGGRYSDEDFENDW